MSKDFMPMDGIRIVDHWLKMPPFFLLNHSPFYLTWNQKSFTLNKNKKL